MRRNPMVYLALIFGFLVGIQDGYIALWTDGCQKPQVFPYRAEMLPRADQQRLKEGIRIEDGSELAQLLEDYLS